MTEETENNHEKIEGSLPTIHDVFSDDDIKKIGFACAAWKDLKKKVHKYGIAGWVAAYVREAWR